MDFDLDALKGLGIDVIVISMITFALLIGSMGMIYAFVYISTFTTHLAGHSLIVSCSSLTPGTYTIFPLYLAAIHSSSDYDILIMCLGEGVAPVSLIYWFIELLPISIILGFIAKKVEDYIG